MKLLYKEYILCAIILATALICLYRPVQNHYEAGINFIALFGLFFSSASDLKDRELSFFQYRHDNSLGIIFPLKGKVTQYVTLSGEEDWLLVKLNQTFEHNLATIAYVLVKRNDKKALIPGKTNQLVFFKLVPDINLIRETGNDKSDFPFEVWALCK